MVNRISDPSGAPLGRDAAPAWAGKRVGRFRLVAELGRGAMGRVFRAEDTLLQRQVAIKVLPKVLRRGDRQVASERLVAEARAAASLDHPNIVTVYEVNESAGVYYIAMELLEGGSLRDLVKAGGPMDCARACLLCADAADALAHAHSLGIIHRDVKPANLMLTRGGRCKLADFGLARMEDAADLSNALPESVGTPQFIAPELLRGQTASPKSDIYSLGATLYYLLTGHPPFEAQTAAELLRKHLEAPLPSLAASRPDLPQGLTQVISHALAKQPAERFDSAQQLEKVLRVYTVPADSSSVALESLVPAASLAKPWYRRRVAAFTAGGAAIAAAVLLILLFVYPGLARSHPQNSPSIGGGRIASPGEGVVPAGPVTLNLLDGLDLSRAAVKGAWTMSNGDLVSDSSNPAILELPAAVPREYDFRIEFTPQDCAEQLLFKPANDPASSGTPFNWCMGVGDLCGIESLNGAHIFDASAPLSKHLVLQPNVRHTSLVQVRDDSVRAFLDGQLVVEYQGNYRNLSRMADWSMRSNNRLGLGTWNKPTHFHRVELVDRTGAAGR